MKYTIINESLSAEKEKTRKILHFDPNDLKDFSGSIKERGGYSNSSASGSASILILVSSFISLFRF